VREVPCAWTEALTSSASARRLAAAALAIPGGGDVARSLFARSLFARALVASSLLAWALAGCGGARAPVAATPEPPPPAVAEAPAPPKSRSFSEWEKTSFGAMMMPDDLPDAFDVIVHFHVGKAAQDDYRAAGLSAVVVGLDHGLFAKAYGEAYDDEERFPKTIEAMTELVRARTGRTGMHADRVALVAWSAGYGAVRKVLAQRADTIDAVILLDGLHTAYRHHARTRSVDLRDLAPFLRFARNAADGKKLMVVTHSQIVPGDYASTTETADALLSSIGLESVAGGEPSAGLTPTSRADWGDFHVRAFEGETKEAHVAQLHLVALALREYLVPRWTRE
jgi:hypothetical protein